MRSNAARMVVLVYESCHRNGEDASLWRAGSELREMERFLLAKDPNLLREMEDELALDERKSVAKTVRRHFAIDGGGF